MDKNQIRSFTTSSSSSSSASGQGTSSESFATATQVTPNGIQTISVSASSSEPVSSSAQASATTSSDGINATANAQPDDSDLDASTSIATGPPAQIFARFPLLIATESSSASSSTSEQISRPLPAVDHVLGSPESDVLVGTAKRDVLTGYAAADTFVLDSVGVSSVTQADVIADFNAIEGDRIGLAGEVTFNNIYLQVVDLDSNGIPESTVISLGTTGTVLAVVLNTVNTVGQPVLTSNSFLSVESLPVL